mgnify:FL=1
MLRRIIKIDEEKCNGCGACASACHEGAIEMVNGKAKLTREDYCDGLGDCLPACPADAISFEEREAPAYDEAAVRQAQAKKAAANTPHRCPGAQAMLLNRKTVASPSGENAVESQLRQWPIKISLVPIGAPYFDNANLLIAADCTAYAYGNFHQDFIRDHITLISCPKQDTSKYAEKLTEIISRNNIKSITIARMEVPCCGALENAAKLALKASGKDIPCKVVTITASGKILA